MDSANNVDLIAQRVALDYGVLRVFTSGGVLTDTLRTNLTGVSYISNIAMAPNGDIVLKTATAPRCWDVRRRLQAEG